MTALGNCEICFGSAAAAILQSIPLKKAANDYVMLGYQLQVKRKFNPLHEAPVFGLF